MHSIVLNAWMWLPILAAFGAIIFLFLRKKAIFRALLFIFFVILGTNAIVLMLVSRTTRSQVVLNWIVLPSGGDVYRWTWNFTINRGGIQLRGNYSKYLTIATLPAGYDQVERRQSTTLTWFNVASDSDYPLLDSAVSMTGKWPFVEKSLGFQLVWFSGHVPWNGNLRGIYSITFPIWAILILCPWVPLFLLIRWHKRQFNQTHGLCQICSFDLRAHKPGDKCPECGTIVPAIAGKSNTETKTTPA